MATAPSSYADTGLIHVLVIDDDPEVRHLIEEILLPEGCQVVGAESAEKGMETLPFYTFDVAFVDHHLPGIQGLVFGEYLRRNNPEMRIALVTGAADESLARRTREDDIRLIEKPFEVVQILDVVGLARQSLLERAESAELRDNPEWAPPLRAHADAIAAHYRMPSVPDRIAERLVGRLQDAMAKLHSSGRYTERDRVIALAGLLAARVLDIKLPRSQRGRSSQSLEEEYDDLMDHHGRRREFTERPDES